METFLKMFTQYFNKQISYSDNKMHTNLSLLEYVSFDSYLDIILYNHILRLSLSFLYQLYPALVYLVDFLLNTVAQLKSSNLYIDFVKNKTWSV